MNTFLSVCRRVGRCRQLWFALALVVVPAGAAAKGQGRAPARVVADETDRVVFQIDLNGWTVGPSPALEGTEKVTVPGYAGWGEPGEPQQLARKYLVGLPPRGSWRLAWRVLKSEPLGQIRLEPVPRPGAREDAEMGAVPFERYEIDGGIYNSFTSPDVVAADEPAWIRRQRVLPVWIRPLTYDPATEEATLATSIEVTVSFTGGGSGEAGAPDRAPAPVVELEEWEAVFSRLLVNAPRAKGWRTPRRSPADRSPSSRAMGQQAGAMVRLQVKRTGVHKVAAADLISAGFPSNQPLDDLRLFKRGYDDDALVATETDIPYKISEHSSGTPGVFDGEDVLIFHGLRLRDDDGQDDPDELYSDHNVYWLAAAPGTGMPDRALAHGYLSADTSDASFPVARRFTDDGAFFEETKQGRTDYYFFTDGSEVETDFPFEMDWVKPLTTVSLTVELQGAAYDENRTIETRLINGEQNLVISPSVTVDDKNLVNYQADLPSEALVAGPNTFHYQRNDAPGKPVIILLNWLEVSYQALYRARGNALHFNTASLAGDTSISITGLSDTSDLWLFDVTDPNSPVNCVLEPSLFTDVGGGSWALTFRDAISSRKDYVLVPEDRTIQVQPGEIAFDTPSDIIGSPAESGVDVLVISHRNFLVDVPGDSYDMHDWVRYRRAQGKEVLMVDVEDVFDEFNGGVPGTRGIDRFIRHFFELGNASYVLLVGDGCEDHKQTYETSNPDFVPSHCRTEYVYAPFNEDEVVTLDKWYVKLPNPSGSVDPYPDLAIGRFPVGSMSELQRILYKVFSYEKPNASDFWRRRMIVVADDGWGEGSGSRSCWDGDTGFRTGQEYCAELMEATHQGAFDVVRLFLSDYNDKYHSASRPCEPNLTMYQLRQLTRLDATLALLNELSQGATLVTVQAHMNRSLITHEWMFVTLSSAPNGNKDHFRCNNRDKPFIIFGMGCHFSDYALHKEMTRVPLNNPNGDAFAEQLLFQNNEGAVATYGSSGFEYLNQVNNYMYRFTEIWFYEAPYQDMVAESRGRWVLGPMMFLVETEAINRHQQQRPVDRYHILGDPLLRIDAGPPLIDVTVNGQPVQSGDDISAGVDTVTVVATVRDENVIEKFELWIDGVDMSSTLQVRDIGGEPIDPARAYEVSFRHAIQFNKYDIVLKAMQAPDTTAGAYHMVAEFVLRVPNDMEVAVNGRALSSGDVVPASGDYELTLKLPTFVPSSEISVKIDDEDVSGLAFTHPAPEDTTTWVIRFSKSLSAGRHDLTVTAGATELPAFTLFVEERVGLRNVINFPNPFTETTQFIYTTDVEIDDGTIDVFTVSGRRVVRLDIPPQARNPGQNAVSWDGRDAAGDEVANGVYLYVINVTQRGQDSTIRGKLARMR